MLNNEIQPSSDNFVDPFELSDEQIRRQEQWKEEEKNSEIERMWYQKDRAENDHLENLNKKLLADENGRSWSSYLTSSYKLQEMINNSASGISETHIASERGTEVRVITLSGAPFAFLVHGILFDEQAIRRGSGLHNTEVAKNYLENGIKTWDTQATGEEYKPSQSSNNISATLISPLTSHYYWGSPEITEENMSYALGFGEVSDDDVRFSSFGDGGINTNAEIARSDDLKDPSEFEGVDNGTEIVMPRYLAPGKARRPDYVVVKDGKIDKKAIEAAEYFNIPIVNIDTKSGNNSQFAIEKATSLISDLDNLLNGTDNEKNDLKIRDTLLSIAKLLSVARQWGSNAGSDVITKNTRLINQAIDVLIQTGYRSDVISGLSDYRFLLQRSDDLWGDKPKFNLN